MHVYLRDEPVDLELREVEAEGLLSPETGLVPVAFFADGNDSPSFRAFLPPETLGILHQVTRTPVRLGLMAEEPEGGAEIQAMVGLTIPLDQLPDGMVPQQEDDDEERLEPWQSSPTSEAWRGGGGDDDDAPRTVLLAFAPLVRISRRHPDDFAEELADLLESALAGATKPSLEARLERMLGL
ncbi:MAG TPA: hypothetical protein VFQ45_09645 [Longimicrobium sp.]|nr:hypothetical protein [Longimicrobium sp.]